LPAQTEPCGTCVEAVRTGNFPVSGRDASHEGHGAKFIGHVGAEFDVEAGPRRLTSRRSTSRCRAAVFGVTTDRLNNIRGLLDRADLVTQVGTALPLEKARTAHEMLARAPHKGGKIVLSVLDGLQQFYATE